MKADPMRHITRVLAVPAVGASHCDDMAALRSKAVPPAERYTARPVTPGFRRVREVAQAVSVGLVLDSQQVAWGDCVAAALGGQAGRDPLFCAGEGLATIRDTVAPALEGRALTSFRELAAGVDALLEPVTVTRPLPPPETSAGDGRVSRRDLLAAPARLWQAARADEKVATEQVTVQRRLHTAVRYGVSQALLKAVALARGLTMTEVIAGEWGLSLPDAPIPIHARSSGERYRSADKMIARRVASLSPVLADNLPEQLGEGAVELTRYARWLKARIQELGGEDYWPTVHLDVQGALGQIFEHNLGRVLGQLYALELAVQPYPLRVESPVVMESREAQIETMKTLCQYIRFRKMKGQLVAGEWANTLDDVRAFVEARAAGMIQVKMPDMGSVHNAVEAVLACQAGGVGVLLGGSGTETDLSARVSAHVALATRPDLVMARPGMGVDEGIALIQNEMARTLAWIRARSA